MVVVSAREAEIIRRVANQREQVRQQSQVAYRRAEAFMTAAAGGARSAAAHANPMREWQQEAAALSSSFMNLTSDIEALRASDRRAWRQDELTAIREVLEAERAAKRDAIHQRLEERVERLMARSERPELDWELTRRESEWGLGRRKERRAVRDATDPRPWASPAHGHTRDWRLTGGCGAAPGADEPESAPFSEWQSNHAPHFGFGSSSNRFPDEQRPSTAPAASRRSRLRVHGQAPPQDESSLMVSGTPVGSVRTRAPRSRATSDRPMSAQPHRFAHPFGHTRAAWA
jgi:hypothetical protein